MLQHYKKLSAAKPLPPIDVIVIILNDYKAIDLKCRQHYEFNSKFKSILAKKALSKDYFENIRQHYKWSE